MIKPIKFRRPVSITFGIRAIKCVTFLTVISLITFARVNRLLVTSTNCRQPKPNFTVTEIPGQNLTFYVGATGVQTIDNNRKLVSRKSRVTGHGSRGSWVGSMMSQMGHGSRSMAHCELWCHSATVRQVQ